MDEVLVTGGAGFIGSHAVEYYANRDIDVTAVDSLHRRDSLDGDRSTTQYNWNYLEDEYPDVELVEADVRHLGDMIELVEGVDGIVHTAGQVAVTQSLDDPIEDCDINAMGTLTILEAARRVDNDPSVVHASTNKVYGDWINQYANQFGDEPYAVAGDGIAPDSSVQGTTHTPHGVSKLAADLYVQDYDRRGIVDATAFRMGCVFGPRQFGVEDQGWIAHFAISALEDEPVTIYGDGHQVRDVLYVDDVIDAYDAALTRPTAPVYTLGGGIDQTLSLNQCLDILQRKIGDSIEIRYDEWRPADQRWLVLDTEQTRADLGWEPRVTITDGIERFIDWYTEET